MTEQVDYVIIGAGICGMQIGALLANKGGKVLVLEKTGLVGGRGRVLVKDGFKLDYGIHPIRFGRKSAIAQTCREVGTEIDFITPGLLYIYLKNGEEHIFPSGSIRAILKTKLIPLSKMIKLFKIIKKQKEPDIKRLQRVSLTEFYKEYNIEPILQLYLNQVSSSMMVNPFPDISSVGELLINVKKVLKDGATFYPRGGWESFFKALDNAILKNNGEVRLNCPVVKILVENGVAVGVETKDGKILAKKVISTVPVQELFSILPEQGLNADWVKKCKTQEPTAGVSLDICLDKPVSDKSGSCSLKKPPAFAFFPTNLDPELAPPGKSIFTACAITDVKTIKDPVKSKELMASLRAAVHQAFPTMKDHIVFERPMMLPMVDGVQISIHQTTEDRPGNKTEPPIKNLYLTGDSCGGDGAGGDVGHTSVRECFELIMKDSKA